jgi:hypothetical protein
MNHALVRFDEVFSITTKERMSGKIILAVSTLKDLTMSRAPTQVLVRWSYLMWGYQMFGRHQGQSDWI